MKMKFGEQFGSIIETRIKMLDRMQHKYFVIYFMLPILIS